MKRLLVVPKRTSYTPEGAVDEPPGLFSEHYDRIDVSVVFTWDIERALWLREAWRGYATRIWIGGPALDERGGNFVPGKFAREGITITSRGCPKRCPWCYVPKREGGIRELPIKPGRIVNDNNLLACSRRHVEKVFRMLEDQSRIDLRGGLDPRLLEDWHVAAIKELRTNEIFLAYDSAGMRKASLAAIEKFREAGFPRWKVRCYVMVGRKETTEMAEERIRETYKAGSIPFVQLYDKLRGDKAWRKFAREWGRIPILKAKIDNPI